VIVYVGGDGHSAAALAATPYFKANDDPALFYLGTVPHPANLAVGWAQRWAAAVRAGLHVEAQHSIDNLEILQRAHLWLEHNARYRPMVIIGWSDFGRGTQAATVQQSLIWQLHCYLKENRCPHLFFNTTQALSCVDSAQDWGINYIGPYDPSATYVQQVEAAGHQTQSPDEPYYGVDAHAFWFRYLLNYTVTHILV
jgi:hypothetical protein